MGITVVPVTIELFGCCMEERDVGERGTEGGRWERAGSRAFDHCFVRLGWKHRKNIFPDKPGLDEPGLGGRDTVTNRFSISHTEFY